MFYVLATLYGLASFFAFMAGIAVMVENVVEWGMFTILFIIVTVLLAVL